MIDALFPEGVITVEATPSMWETSLHPAEEDCLGNVVEKRRREFTAGRASAREALAMLRIHGQPVLRGSDRAPIWPEGIVGSIAHTDDWCGAAVARVGRVVSIGLDAETAIPLPSAVVPLVLTDREIARHAELPAAPPGLDWHTVAFSAKECTYKCLFPMTRTFLEFSDVEVRLDPATQSFVALVKRGPMAFKCTRELSGRFVFDGRRVYTGATLPAAPGL